MAKQKARLPGATQQHVRMNFLYQAANLMSVISDPVPPQLQQLQRQSHPRKNAEKDHDHEDHPHCRQIHWQGTQGLHPLSRYYNNTMKKISQRLVSRLDPHVKRSVCRRCHASLIPAMTSTVRIRSRPETTSTVTTCNTCGLQKRLLARPQYQLFNDRPDIHYNRSTSDDELDEQNEQRYQQGAVARDTDSCKTSKEKKETVPINDHIANHDTQSLTSGVEVEETKKEEVV